MFFSVPVKTNVFPENFSERFNSIFSNITPLFKQFSIITLFILSDQKLTIEFATIGPISSISIKVLKLVS